MNPEYADELTWHEVHLTPISEEALDLDFTTDESMWEWYGNIMAALGTITLVMAEEKPEEFRFPFLKVPFVYNLTEME